MTASNDRPEGFLISEDEQNAVEALEMTEVELTATKASLAAEENTSERLERELGEAQAAIAFLWSQLPGDHTVNSAEIQPHEQAIVAAVKRFTAKNGSLKALFPLRGLTL